VKPDDAAGLAKRVSLKRTVVADTSVVRELVMEFKSLRIPLWRGPGICTDCNGFQLTVDSSLGVDRFDRPMAIGDPLADWVGRVERTLFIPVDNGFVKR
jgi:hypothetical protein